MATDSFQPPVIPTYVYYTMSVNALSKISSVDSSFFTDFYVAYLWQDDRLAGLPPSGFDSATMFNPVPEFVNALDEFSIDLDYALLNGSALPAWPALAAPPAPDSTWVLATGRKQRQFAAVLELEEFPFDSQTAQVVMESKLWTTNELRWVAAPRVMNALQGVSTDGWDTIGVSVTVTNFTYTALDQVYSRLTFNVNLRRQSVYYMTRIVTNVILLVVMACCVSFINALEADRLGFVQACFLGVVSWLFIIVSDTPRVGYLTRLDAFVNASFAAIFIMFVYNAVHAGYFKTIDKLSGYKSGEDGEPGGFVEDASGEDASGATSPAILFNNPTRSTSLAVAPASVDKDGLAKRFSVANAGASEPRGPISASERPARGPARQCRDWPCSYQGEWRKWNPHRKIDFIITAVVLVGYLISVGATLGRQSS